MKEVEPRKEEKKEDAPIFTRRYKRYLMIMIPLVLIAAGILAALYIGTYSYIDSLMPR